MTFADARERRKPLEVRGQQWSCIICSRLLKIIHPVRQNVSERLMHPRTPETWEELDPRSRVVSAGRPEVEEIGPLRKLFPSATSALDVGIRRKAAGRRTVAV